MVFPVAPPLITGVIRPAETVMAYHGIIYGHDIWVGLLNHLEN
jgi:hypothetical protein